jgi:hypothetical protein
MKLTIGRALAFEIQVMVECESPDSPDYNETVVRLFGDRAHREGRSETLLVTEPDAKAVWEYLQRNLRESCAALPMNVTPDLIDSRLIASHYGVYRGCLAAIQQVEKTFGLVADADPTPPCSYTGSRDKVIPWCFESVRMIQRLTSNLIVNGYETDDEIIWLFETEDDLFLTLKFRTVVPDRDNEIILCASGPERRWFTVTSDEGAVNEEWFKRWVRSAFDEVTR